MSDHCAAPCAELQQQLTAALNPAALQSLHGRIRLHWTTPATPASPASQSVAFALEHGAFEWIAPTADTDVSFYFANSQLMLDILCGNADPIAAFMRGDFRSSGYLLWTFPLLTLFRAGP